MLDKTRIKEAESNVKNYLREGLLKKEQVNNQALGVLVKNAQESIYSAEKLSDGTSDLWVIVCSYYSMFYIANAVLRKIGYKVGDKIVHKVTSDALISLARNKLKESLIEEYEDTKEEALSLAGVRVDSLLESFDFEKNKRGRIQYQTDAIEKKSKAGTSLKRAKAFFSEMQKILIDSEKRIR